MSLQGVHHTDCAQGCKKKKKQEKQLHNIFGASLSGWKPRRKKTPHRKLKVASGFFFVIKEEHKINEQTYYNFWLNSLAIFSGMDGAHNGILSDVIILHRIGDLVRLEIFAL